VLSPRASRAILHSRHPADCILPILVRKVAVCVFPATVISNHLRTGCLSILMLLTPLVQAAKKWQWQLRLLTTPSAGTCMTACTLHKCPRASSSLSRLTTKVTWACCGDEKSFLRICSKDNLAEKAQDIEVTIPVKKSQEPQYNLNPESFYFNCFWGRWLVKVAINKTLQIAYILEFNQSTDRNERFLEVKWSRSKWAAQKHHWCAQSCCSEVGIWAD